MVHVYEDHIGGVYFSKDYGQGLLETCGLCCDSDIYLGFAHGKSELKDMLRGAYPDHYIEQICNDYIKFMEDK